MIKLITTLSLKWWLALAVVASFMSATGLRLLHAPGKVAVTIEFSASTSGEGQIFVPDNGGYNELSSVKFPMEATTAIQRHRIELPVSGVPDRFRFDPGTGTGMIRLHRIEMHWQEHDRDFVGKELIRAVKPLNDLRPESIGDDRILSFRSTGPDPYLEIEVPEDLVRMSALRRALGTALSAGGLLVLAGMILALRNRIHAGLVRNRILLAPLAFVLATAGTIVLLWPLDAGCENVSCSVRGFRYGLPLFAASVAFAIIGATVLRAASPGATAGNRLFLHVVVGQAAAMLYVQARSAAHASLGFPSLHEAELPLLTAACALGLWLRRVPNRTSLDLADASRLVLQAGILFALCLVTADRELPRVVMLSSDPDTHAFFARRVEIAGAVPWGTEAGFGYPAGSPVLAWAWAKLGGMDVRNALSALPVLQTYLAALVLGEAFSHRTRHPAGHAILMATSLAITAAGFMLPYFSNFAHMEGTGRQMVAAFLVVVPAVLIARQPDRPVNDGRTLWITGTLSLFAISALNPISAILPVIAAFAYSLHELIQGRRLSPLLLALLGFPLLLVLDPFYASLLPGSDIQHAPRIGISPQLGLLTFEQMAERVFSPAPGTATRIMADLTTFFPRHGIPLFAAAVALFCVAHATLSPRRPGWRTVPPCLTAIVLVACAQIVFLALAIDRRFYLLAPYFSFSLGQAKMLVATAMALSVTRLALERHAHAWRAVFVAGISTALVWAGVRHVQDFRFTSRHSYCGSLGCATESDLEVLAQIAGRPSESLLDVGSSRILVPNSLHPTRDEYWIFPVSGARAAPFETSASFAFFYFYGDRDFTVENYLQHVCRNFDRDWLIGQGVEYVFLPANRSAACIDGIENLPKSESVVLRSGNSYLLRIRPTE